MSKYNLEINNLLLGTDISEEELAEIIAEADRIILKNKEPSEKIAEAYLKKSQCLQKLGKYQESKAIIEKALKLTPTMAEAITQLGNIFIEERNYDEAIARNTEAIQLKPDYAAAFINRGNVFSHKIEYDQAIADYTEAIRLKPDYTAAFYNRGIAYHKKHEYDQAIADYREAMRLEPDFSRVYFLHKKSDAIRELVEEAMGDTKKPHWLKKQNSQAVENIEAVYLQPDIARAFFCRAEMYCEKCEYTEAIDDLSEAIRLDPSKAFYFIKRGGLYANKMGEFEKAVVDYSNAIHLTPKPSTPSFNPFRILMVYLRGGDLLSDLENKDYFQTLIQRGKIYEAQGQHDKAAVDYDMVKKAIKTGQHTLGWDITMKSITNFIDVKLAPLIEKANKIIRENNETLDIIAEAYLTKGFCLFFIQHEEASMEAVKKSLEIYSGMTATDTIWLKSEVVQDLLTYINASIDKFDEAIADWTTFFKFEPRKKCNFLNNRGNDFFNKAKLTRDLEKWFKGMQPINIDPKKVIHGDSKTLFCLAANDYTEAIESKYLKPENLVKTIINRRIAYIEAGEHDKAIADCNKALERNIEDTDALALRGVAYDAKGDHDQAIVDYTRAIELTPPKYRDTTGDYYYNRGLAHDEKGKYELALVDYTEAININDRDISAHNNRSILYRMLGQMDKAEADIARLNKEYLGETVFRHGRKVLFPTFGF